MRRIFLEINVSRINTDLKTVIFGFVLPLLLLLLLLFLLLPLFLVVGRGRLLQELLPQRHPGLVVVVGGVALVRVRAPVVVVTVLIATCSQREGMKWVQQEKLPNKIVGN